MQKDKDNHHQIDVHLPNSSIISNSITLPNSPNYTDMPPSIDNQDPSNLKVIITTFDGPSFSNKKPALGPELKLQQRKKRMLSVSTKFDY